VEQRLRRPGRQRVSLSMIAAEAGVSASTVSRIVNGHLNRANPQTVAAVRALLDRHGYRPDRIARALRRGESRVVAMLAPNLDNPAMGAIASSTEAALRAAGYVMILCDFRDQPALQDEYLEAMQAQSVEAFIIVSAVASPVLARFAERGEPMVFVGRRPKQTRNPVAFVGIDNHAAGRSAAAFMVEAGVRSPAIVHTARSSSAVADRMDGFLAGLHALGIPRDVVRIGFSPQLRHLEAGYETARGLVADGGWPQGIFCVSDLMAYGVYRFAGECGVNVPADCLITGVDDSPLNEWIASWLSSVHVPYTDYGAAILKQLEVVWSGAPGTDLLLPHRLVNRLGPSRQRAMP